MAIATEPKISIKSVLLAAIGGQGGNVLAEWLFLAAERDGRRAQALSLPGLSQRGGGTNFYLEFASLEKPSGDKASDTAALQQAVFAQFPFPGRVDVLVGQELVELGRLLQGGFATRRTTVIASSQRIFTIDEKMPAFDGVFPAEKIVEAASRLAGAISIIETAELAKQNGLGELATNAILLGALSAVPEALPMSAERYREAIQEFGLASEMNLKAFEVGRQYQLNFNQEYQQLEAQIEQIPRDRAATPQAGLELAQTIPVPGPQARDNDAADSGTAPLTNMGRPKAKRQIALTPISRDKGKAKIAPDPAQQIETKAALLPVRTRQAFGALAGEIVNEWPRPLQNILIEAVYQMTDYQDLHYARRYLKMVKKVFEQEKGISPDRNQFAQASHKVGGEAQEFGLTQTYAKTLAMRMTYEDATRVAILKIAPGRLARIKRDMGLKPGQVLRVTDYLKPDAAEIYGILPNILVGPLLLLGKLSGIGLWFHHQHFTLQLHPKPTALSGYLTFRFLTLFKPFRLASHRFHQEWKLIEQYTQLVLQYAAQNAELGQLVAESGRLVKGYGDTRRKMIGTMGRYYTNVLTPLVKWEERNPNPALAPFAVTLKAARNALQMIGRNDEGIEQAESLAHQILAEAKAGQSRAEILAQVDRWSRAK